MISRFFSFNLKCISAYKATYVSNLHKKNTLRIVLRNFGITTTEFGVIGNMADYLKNAPHMSGSE